MKNCEVCHETEARYRCPRCSIQTCCLKCVNQHKEGSSCNGERDKTEFVALNQFSDIHLLNDYRFLEDVSRKNNNASRDLLKRKHNKPGFLKELEKQASLRNIRLQTQPYPMSKRKSNFTTYQHKSRQILWQIEWIFPSVDLSLIDKRVSETDSLETILNRHIGPDADPITRHKLKPYINADKETWAIFLLMEGHGKVSRYHRLDYNKSLLDNLAHKEIVEYPTLFVVHKSEWSHYDTSSSEQLEEPKPSVANNSDSTSVN